MCSGKGKLILWQRTTTSTTTKLYYGWSIWILSDGEGPLLACIAGRRKVLKDKGLFLVVQLDYHLQVGLTESISWFCSMLTLSFFKWNGKSPSSPVMGFFLVLMARVSKALSFVIGQLCTFYVHFLSNKASFRHPVQVTILREQTLQRMSC